MSDESLSRRRKLRATSTTPERLMWWVLRDRRLRDAKFRRQHSIGPFIVDFVCLEKKLVIEIDGLSHERTIERDASRTEYLEERGFRVIRYSNEDVLENLEGVIAGLEKLLAELVGPG